MSYLLALDAGTGSVRAVVFDLQGRQIAVGQAEWKHLSVENVPGSMEFDLSVNWQLACQCIRQALAAAHLSAADIQSVACCSMREGIVLYDRNGEAIWACANVDACFQDTTSYIFCENGIIILNEYKSTKTSVSFVLNE